MSSDDIISLFSSLRETNQIESFESQESKETNRVESVAYQEPQSRFKKFKNKIKKFIKKLEIKKKGYSLIGKASCS